MSEDWHIGVIGGSGLYQLDGLSDVQQIDVKSPFGVPSGPVTLGRIGEVKFAFLARHGAGHSLPPSAVNYRANIDVLKRCGVSDVLAVSAVGSLRKAIEPGQFVTVDQYIDSTHGRENSFFGPGLAAHVSLADPVCPRLSDMAANAAQEAGAHVHRSGTYITIDGPQFSSRAESQLYRAWGADVIGMTGMPEARLAREAELPYAILGLVTDYDSWREDESGVAASDVLQTVQANTKVARKTLEIFAERLPKQREVSAIDKALDGAIITERAAWDQELALRLGAVAGRVLQE